MVLRISMVRSRRLLFVPALHIVPGLYAPRVARVS